MRCKCVTTTTRDTCHVCEQPTDGECRCYYHERMAAGLLEPSEFVALVQDGRAVIYKKPRKGQL